MARPSLVSGLFIGTFIVASMGCGDTGSNGNAGSSGSSGSAGSSAGNAGNAGSSAGNSGAAGSAGTGGCAAIPMFETDIVPIFEKSCGAKDNACHSRVAYGADKDLNCGGWLSLENAAIGSQIYAGPDIGQSTGCPDMPLYERLTQLIS